MTHRISTPPHAQLGRTPSWLGRLRHLRTPTTPTCVPYVELAAPSSRHRCCVCHRSGQVVGHRSPDGRIQWVHRSCHRRLHRSLSTTS